MNPRIVVDLFLLLAFFYVIYDFYVSYKGAIGSAGQRTLAAFKGSLTILWARFTVAVAAAAGGLTSVADFLGAPGVSSAIQTYMKPSYVAALMISIAVITEWARRRTLPAA